MELHTNCKTINVAKAHLQLANSNRPSTEGSVNSHFPPATPSAFTRTPMREDMPSTPMRHATPSHAMSTPSRDPFNPAIPNTPRPHDMRHGGWDDDGWGNPPTPRAANTPIPTTPGTPGGYGSYGASYYNPSTPVSHTPQTPGSAYTPSSYGSTPQDSTPHTPFSSNTPLTPLTPSTPLTPHTPGSGLGIPQTPSTPLTPSTPGSALSNYEAIYGESSSYYDEHTTPQTPRVPEEEIRSAPMQWQMPKLQVTVSATFKSGAYAGATGVIADVLSTDQCRVTLTDRGNESITVPNDSLEMVAPGKKDRLRVVGGEFRGETGVLVGVYGNDGIVKMDVTMDIKILPMTNLAKMAS